MIIGLTDTINNMDPKLKQLFQQILTVVIVVMVLYGAITFILTILEGKPMMHWFGTEHFITTVVVVIFVLICSSILSGKEIVVPEQFKKKEGEEKKQFNFPDTWGVNQFKMNQPKQPKKQTKKPRTIKRKTHGSWRCPKCQTLVIGDTCPKCGHRR